MASRIFFHPLTLFALLLGSGVFVFDTLGVLVKTSLARDNPSFHFMLSLLGLGVGLFYPILLGWYVCTIPPRPRSPHGSGPTSRIHHPLSLLFFPTFWFAMALSGCIEGFFRIHDFETAKLQDAILFGFVCWWVVPVEWWSVMHRFMEWEPRWGTRPNIVQAVRVALVGTGLQRRSDDALEPAFAQPLRPVSSTVTRGREGFDWQAFTELGFCVGCFLVSYLIEGWQTGRW